MVKMRAYWEAELAGTGADCIRAWHGDNEEAKSEGRLLQQGARAGGSQWPWD